MQQDTTYYADSYEREIYNGILAGISPSGDEPSAGRSGARCGRRRLALHVPGRCESFDCDHPYECKDGYAYLEFDGEAMISFAMTVRVVGADGSKMISAVFASRADRRSAALRAWITARPAQCSHRPQTQFTATDDEPSLSVITAAAYREDARDDLYGCTDPTYTPITLRFIPYHAFAHRGESNMKVWIDRMY